MERWFQLVVALLTQQGKSWVCKMKNISMKTSSTQSGKSIIDYIWLSQII